MIKFSPGAIPKEVGDQICCVERVSLSLSATFSRGEALWHNKCITFKKSGGKKVCPSWLATVHGDTVTGWGERGGGGGGGENGGAERARALLDATTEKNEIYELL